MIDLRSDTVTQPTQAMRDAMAQAAVGDDVYGDDPTVNRLEEMAADRMGKEAAIFTPSGTQANLMALLTHCERGDEYIVGQQAHTYRFEGGGAAVLGSIQPQPLDFEPDGTLDLKKVVGLIKPDDPHFARTKLFCLENTQAGKALPMEYLKTATDLARKNGLFTHLDGARVFNAAIKHQVPVARIADHFDTLSFCLSKGLGAPVGSILCGKREQIQKARRWRKMLGGGMRQAGIMAAAGIHALEHHIDRLQEDHDHAAWLARELAKLDQLSVEYTHQQTNMVFVHVNVPPDKMATFLKDKGILITARNPLRLVIHLGIQKKDIPLIINAFKQYLS